jgi:hypothetical protein
MSRLPGGGAMVSSCHSTTRSLVPSNVVGRLSEQHAGKNIGRERGASRFTDTGGVRRWVSQCGADHDADEEIRRDAQDRRQRRLPDDSGANDITFALTLNPTDRQTYLTAQAGALAKMIKALQTAGATHLIIVNQPESFGTTDQRSARQFYDSELRISLNAQAVTYVWGDRNRVRQDVVASLSAFHMLYTDNSQAHIACPQNAGFLLCSANSAVITPTSFAQQTLFADDGHWASEGQRALGSYDFCLVKKSWPGLVPTLPFPPMPRPPFACGVFSEFALTR